MPTLQSRRHVVLLALSASLGLAACGGGGGDAGNPLPTDPGPGWSSVTTLNILEVAVGTGVAADALTTPGKTPTVAYTLYLYDQRVADKKGTRVDSSTGYTFELGRGRVIAGFETGVTGMKVGGKRTVTVPASLAYGTTGSGPVPPNAALVFDIELLKVE
jgi:FKBP-type peptidyl-prolyl cis-trans isomerase